MLTGCPPAISASALTKTYTYSELPPGTWAAVRSLVRRPRLERTAVSALDLVVGHGEIIGLLGPNGAGKTTTIKMFCGLLHPTSGQLDVLGFRPARRQFDFLRNISVIFGQKSMLWWDVSTYESLLIHKRIYALSSHDFRNSVEALAALLDIEDVLHVPVRKLSLGQRMRCELVLALLHQPALLFADEPTVGLDVVAKVRVRGFLQRVNEELGTTIVLTSHDMDDVEALCKRVAVITGGTIAFDGALETLRQRMRPTRELVLTYADPVKPPAQPGVRLVHEDADRRVLRLEVNREDVARLLAQAGTWGDLRDVRITDADLDTVMAEIFTARVTA